METNMRLDLYKAAAPGGAVEVRRGDDSAVVVAEITDHGAPFDLEGWTAKFEAVTDSGESVRAACQTDGGRVRFAIPPFSKSGRSKAAYVRLEKDGAVVTTNDMEVMVL